jgi:hypothetical protein
MQSHLLQLRDAVPTATWDQRPTGQKGANWPFSPSPQSPKLISARKPLGIRHFFARSGKPGMGPPIAYLSPRIWMTSLRVARQLISPSAILRASCRCHGKSKNISLIFARNEAASPGSAPRQLCKPRRPHNGTRNRIHAYKEFGDWKVGIGDGPAKKAPTGHFPRVSDLRN